MRKLVHHAGVRSLLGLALLALPAVVHGQPLPQSVRRFVSNLDVRCYQIPNQPPINVPLHLDHLNPVLQGLGLPPEDVILREPQQLCVPVQKNNNVPPPDVLPFLQFVDWKCYGISGPPVNVPLHLDHLNPVIAQMLGPSDDVILREPQQLCVPVAKNGNFPPPEVQRLVQFLDVKCYRVDSNRQIQLTHLNPLFSGLPPESATFANGPLQLCVPVTKNGLLPPPDVLPFIQFSDVLCYAINGRPLNVNLRLDHLNPVLIAMGLPPEQVLVTATQKLCVPVAKNGKFPPDTTGSATTP